MSDVKQCLNSSLYFHLRFFFFCLFVATHFIYFSTHWRVGIHSLKTLQTLWHILVASSTRYRLWYLRISYAFFILEKGTNMFYSQVSPFQYFTWKIRNKTMETFSAFQLATSFAEAYMLAGLGNDIVVIFVAWNCQIC